MSDTIKIPAGWAVVRKGALLIEGDMGLSSRGEWFDTHAIGAPVGGSHRGISASCELYVRRIPKPK